MDCLPIDYSNEGWATEGRCLALRSNGRSQLLFESCLFEGTDSNWCEKADLSLRMTRKGRFLAPVDFVKRRKAHLSVAAKVRLCCRAKAPHSHDFRSGVGRRFAAVGSLSPPDGMTSLT